VYYKLFQRAFLAMGWRLELWKLEHICHKGGIELELRSLHFVANVTHSYISKNTTH